jgi:molybdopterin-guanine dinucleotide biosynthesis protein A
MLRPPTPVAPISGGILAGGEGRRFGGLDKGWIEHDGRPFIMQVLGALAPQVEDVTISANRHLDRYRALGQPVVSDRLGAGPLAGLLRLLESSPQPWLLSLPCDALDVPDDLARQMLSLRQATDADIVVLEDDEGVHPIVALTRTALAADLEAFLLDGGRSVQQWQARHRRVCARRRGCFVNVNDAAVLHALHSRPEALHG